MCDIFNCIEMLFIKFLFFYSYYRTCRLSKNGKNINPNESNRFSNDESFLLCSSNNLISFFFLLLTRANLGGNVGDIFKNK